MFTNLKNSFTSRVNDKCVVKWLIVPKILGYTTLWFIINCNTYLRMMPFFCIHISQGSVATCLKRDGIFKHDCRKFTTESASEKNFENRIIVSEVMAKSLVSCFLTHGVVCVFLILNVKLRTNCCINCLYSYESVMLSTVGLPCLHWRYLLVHCLDTLRLWLLSFQFCFWLYCIACSTVNF